MRRMARGVLATVLATACGTSSNEQAPPTEMVLHEELFIGRGNPDEYALTTVVDLTRDSLGSFYVAQPMDQSVWKYDSAGTFQGKIGRRGGGPGEFAMPSEVGFRGDSVWVSDPDLSRLTIFSPAGGKTVLTPRLDLSPLHFYPARLLKDGTIFSHPSTPLHLVSSGQITHLPLLRLAGDQLDTIALLPLAHKWWIMRDESRPDFGEGYAPQPFADDPLFAVSPEGDEIVVVNREASTPPRLTIVRYRPDGAPLDTILLTYPPISVAEEQITQSLTKLSESIGRSRLFASPADAARSLKKTLYVPPHLPSATRVVLGVDGRIWLRREETGSPSVTWWVLNPKGLPEYKFLAPSALTLLYANGQSAAGYILDELDVPHIVAYSLKQQTPQ